jgi:hypothetical protein
MILQVESALSNISLTNALVVTNMKNRKCKCAKHLRFENIFSTIVRMAISRTELEKIARQLRSALEVIEAELAPIEIPPEIQAEVERKMAARICLAWDHQIPEGETVYRGCCETDYQTLMARMRRGQETESALMMAGKLGPKGSRGRKAALDVAASQKAAEGKMAEQRAKHAAESKEKYKKGTDDTKPAD